MVVWDVVSVHQGFMNVVSNETLVSVDNIVYRNAFTENGRGRMLQPRPKEFVNYKKRCAEALKTSMIWNSTVWW